MRAGDESPCSEGRYFHTGILAPDNSFREEDRRMRLVYVQYQEWGKSK